MTTIVIILLFAVLLAAYEMIALKRKSDEKNQGVPVEIPENDREWKIRTELVERIRVEIVKGLDTSGGCWINTEADGKNLRLNHGEAHALLMPFLQKGYFAYIGHKESNVSGLSRFGVVKHRLLYNDELEITEELLIKNAQL